MVKANFFLIGAAKAGTTSVARFLESIPGTYFSPIKEPCYFCPDINRQTKKEFERQRLVDLDSYIDAGMTEPIHMHQVERPDQYARLFEGAGDATVIGECSTSYMPSIEAADLIHDYNPEARILAIIRDPISRIRSHYLMDRRIGLERRPLATCLDEEMKLGEAADFSNCRMYLRSSDYGPQIERFRKRFGDDQLMVMRFEEIVKQPDTYLPSLLEFIGLPGGDVSYALPRENSSDKNMPRLSWLDAVLYRGGLKNHIRYHLPRILPEKLKAYIKDAYFGDGRREKENLTDEWQALDSVQRLYTNYHAAA